MNKGPQTARQMMTPTTDSKPGRWHRWVIGVLSVVIAMIVGWVNLDQGWIPHDDGQLGQAAERILAGELPHRDFDEMYTGGLSYLHALSFKLWGVNSHSMRWMLFIWFVPFVAGVYWLVSEYIKGPMAGVVTVLAAAWSIPMYSAAMPSWYNLFFATWALCATLMFATTNARRYLLLAGLMVGLSIVFKISGLFVLAGLLLFVLYRNQTQAAFKTQTVFENELSNRSGRAQGVRSIEKSGPGQKTQPLAPARDSFQASDDIEATNTSRFFSILVSVALLAASLLSLKFVNHHDAVMQTIHFVIPFVALTGFVLFHEWTAARGSFLSRLRNICLDLTPLMIGVALPVLALLSIYIRENAINDWVQGTLILPAQRMEFASAPFPKYLSLVYSIPLLLLLFPSYCGALFQQRRERKLVIITFALAMLLFVFRYTSMGIVVTFQGFRHLGPLLVLGNLILIHVRRDSLTGLRKQQLFLITAVAFFVSLIQFPYASHIYFFYAAPLLLLTAVASTQNQEWVPKRTLTVVVLFLLAFTLFRFHTPMPNICMDVAYRPGPIGRLTTQRSQIRLDARLAAVYNRIDDLIVQHTAVGQTIFSTPDSPMFSYLSDRKELNGVMYEFFHEGLYDDLDALRQQLSDEEVNLAIINEKPQFSPEVTQAFRDVALADFEPLELVELNWGERQIGLYTVYLRRVK